MSISRHENLAATNLDLYNLTVSFRQKLLWPKDGSSASEYEDGDKRMIMFLAFDPETNLLCGMVGYDQSTNRLRQLVIDPDHQCRGIGSRLVEYARKEALSYGNTTLMVHAWKESVGFYSKKGFTLIEQPYLSKGVWCQKLKLDLKKD